MDSLLSAAAGGDASAAQRAFASLASLAHAAGARGEAARAALAASPHVAPGRALALAALRHHAAVGGGEGAGTRFLALRVLEEVAHAPWAWAALGAAAAGAGAGAQQGQGQPQRGEQQGAQAQAQAQVQAQVVAAASEALTHGAQRVCAGAGGVEGAAAAKAAQLLVAASALEGPHALAPLAAQCHGALQRRESPATLTAAFLLARALAEVTCAPAGFRGVLAAQRAALREAVLALATELQAQTLAATGACLAQARAEAGGQACAAWSAAATAGTRCAASLLATCGARCQLGEAEAYLVCSAAAAVDLPGLADAGNEAVLSLLSLDRLPNAFDAALGTVAKYAIAACEQGTAAVVGGTFRALCGNHLRAMHRTGALLPVVDAVVAMLARLAARGEADDFATVCGAFDPLLEALVEAAEENGAGAGSSAAGLVGACVHSLAALSATLAASCARGAQGDALLGALPGVSLPEPTPVVWDKESSLELDDAAEVELIGDIDELEDRAGLVEACVARIEAACTADVSPGAKVAAAALSVALQCLGRGTNAATSGGDDAHEAVLAGARLVAAVASSATRVPGGPSMDTCAPARAFSALLGALTPDAATRSDASAVATAAVAGAVAALAADWLPTWLRGLDQTNSAAAAVGRDALVAAVRALVALLSPPDTELPPCASERLEYVQTAAASALDRALASCRGALLPTALEAVAPAINGAAALEVETHSLLFMAVASALLSGDGSQASGGSCNAATAATAATTADAAGAWCEEQFEALMRTVLTPVQTLLGEDVGAAAFCTHGASTALRRAATVMHAVVLCASTATRAARARGLVWRHGCAALLEAALRARAAYAAAVAGGTALPETAVATEEAILRLAGACIDTMRGEAGAGWLRMQLAALLEQLRAVPPTFGGIGGGAGSGGALSLLARAVRSPERSLDELVPPLLDACISTSRAALAAAMSSAGDDTSAAAGAQLHLYRLPLDVLRYRWRYFAGSSTAAMAAALACRNGGAAAAAAANGGKSEQPRAELAAQILSHALSAFSATGVRPPPDVLRAVLDAARMLNKQRRLYSSGVFAKTREAFVSTMLDVLLDDTHRPLHDAAVAELHAMAAVDMRGFLTAFLPQYLQRLGAAVGADAAALAMPFAAVSESCSTVAFGMAVEALATDFRLHGRRTEAQKAPQQWASAVAQL